MPAASAACVWAVLLLEQAAGSWASPTALIVVNRLPWLCSCKPPRENCLGSLVLFSPAVLSSSLMRWLPQARQPVLRGQNVTRSLAEDSATVKGCCRNTECLVDHNTADRWLCDLSAVHCTAFDDQSTFGYALYCGCVMLLSSLWEVVMYGVLLLLVHAEELHRWFVCFESYRA
jgi:hypothetical protein